MSKGRLSPDVDFCVLGRDDSDDESDESGDEEALSAATNFLNLMVCVPDNATLFLESPSLSIGTYCRGLSWIRAMDVSGLLCSEEVAEDSVVSSVSVFDGVRSNMSFVLVDELVSSG